ncbi:type 1 glutamine amidotransferase [Kitasatospora putterlickiae]|uniref:Type 1 glutamine amidotransferase n=1 Tax=Kitasatospora putterlickiae TaxID=221725 RepID=A0ABN1YA26_9ACTN
MRALVIQHDHVSGPGLIGECLAGHGYDLDAVTVVPAERYRAPAVDFAFPDPAGYDLIVPLGAPWSVYEEAVGGWVGGELELLRRAHLLGVPVLGVCFGAQALAAALGGSVERAPHAELGWMDIDTDAPELVPSGPWFQSHYDRFTLPPGAVELARSAAGPQAYRIGRSLGVQFHPELTEEILRSWLDHGLAGQARDLGLDPRELMARTRELAQESRDRAHGLVGAFLDVAAGVDVAALTERQGLGRHEITDRWRDW